MAQERTAADPGGYIPGSIGDRRRDAQRRKIKGPSWRTQKVPKPRYVVVLSRVRIVVLTDGGEAHEERVEHVVGPYLAFRPAEQDAKSWTGGAWIANVMPLTSPRQFEPEV